MLDQGRNPTRQDPSRCPAPAAVEQPDRTGLRRHQIDGNAVGDGHREQDPAGPGGVSINALDLHPAFGAGMVRHSHVMNLVPQDDRLETRFSAPEGPPAGHDLAHRGIGPEPEVKASSGRGPPPGDASHHAILLPPPRDLVPGHRTREWDFSGGNRHAGRWGARLTPPVRSGRRGRGGGCRSARSRARSGPRCGWCSAPPPRGRQGAWPCRRGCPGIRPFRPGAGPGRR